jgi:hypothetical protein
VKTGSLAVLLFLFFLLLGFNHFVEEGLAEAVNITHALLGKAPKIKFKKALRASCLWGTQKVQI